MNALRKIQVFALVMIVALVVVSVAAPSAQANGCHGPSYSYANYGSSYYNSNFCYPSNYNVNYFTPAVQYYAQPVAYPVTMYDCYGRPYVIWQTSYGQTLPNAFGQ